MEKVLTEAELWEEDQKNGQHMHRHFEGPMCDKQDGVIHGFCCSIKFDERGLKNLNDLIEKWIDEKTNDPVLYITTETVDGQKHDIPFHKYIVNFQDVRNCFDQWIIVKCGWDGYPKIHSRFIQHVIHNTMDLYEHDKDDVPMCPNVFNLLSREQGLRNHSSALKPMPTQKEIDDIIAGWSKPTENTKWDDFDNSSAKAVNEESRREKAETEPPLDEILVVGKEE